MTKQCRQRAGAELHIHPDFLRVCFGLFMPSYSSENEVGGSWKPVKAAVSLHINVICLYIHMFVTAPIFFKFFQKLSFNYKNNIIYYKSFRK